MLNTIDIVGKLDKFVEHHDTNAVLTNAGDRFRGRQIEIDTKIVSITAQGQQGLLGNVTFVLKMVVEGVKTDYSREKTT